MPCAASRAPASSTTSVRTTANSSLPTRATVVDPDTTIDRAARDLLEQQVAVVMAERRVHLFEAVDVEHHDGDATEVVDCLLQTIDEKDAVGEAGETVVQRLVPGALLRRGCAR